MISNTESNNIGRKLIIKQKGNDIVSQTLYIDGEFDLKTSSNFNSLWKASSNSLLNIVSSSFTFGGKSLPSGQFAMQGVQVWESTEPLEFTISAHLYMNDDAFTDVVAPAMTLINLSLPTKKASVIGDENGNVKIGTFTINLTTLIPPGPNIDAILRANGSTTSGVDLGDLKSTESKGVFTITIADYVTIPNVIIKGVDAQFSKILDEEGYPIECELSFEFRTLEIATTDMINNILSSMRKPTKDDNTQVQ